MALIFADLYSWAYVYQFMGFAMLIGSAGALICYEPDNQEIAILRFDEALLGALKTFLIALVYGRQLCFY
jgi:hypothetical protein